MAPSGAPFGVLSRCMRLSGKAATVSGTLSRGLTGRGSGCGDTQCAASAWPVAREVPAGWCTNPTGTLARGMFFDHWRSSIIPAVFVRPAVWMFATALAPCLCASEARPSDRGIQILRHPTAKPSFQPHVRRETVAAGRGLAPATVLLPGAGPASPDIASSGVSEGGTGMSLREEKWAGMKKCFGV